MDWFDQLARERRDPGLRRPLTIGLINNTSDRALPAIERQFLTLLWAASAGMELNFRFFTCPEIRRAKRPQSSMGHSYSNVDELYDMHLDGLIVTGMEPQATALRDEPIWGSIVRLADWAEEQAVPVVWSCLAAHAAVLHLDGIPRSRLREKLSGIFACDVVATDQKLATGLPSGWATPHSRHYGLREDALVANGYQILSRSDEAGVDIFIKHTATTFVFIQGHPEYGGDSLLREYTRDVRRYIVGERNDFPSVPEHYFTTDSEAALDKLRQDALRGQRDPAILEAVSRLVKNQAPPNTWRAAAARFYANWLTCIARDDFGSHRLDRRSRHGIDQRRPASPSVARVALNQ
jgi:homoserine O-succinyltransferase/O-acetyltransferase